MADPIPQRYLRVEQAAAYLSIEPTSLRRKDWRIKHQIPSVRLGRCLLFDKAALDAFMAERQEREVGDG